MSKRITIVLDDIITKKLRIIQSKKISKTKEFVRIEQIQC